MLHYVSMGWNCGLLALCSMYFAHTSSTRWRRVFFVLLTIIAFVFMYWSRTRGAVIGGIVAGGYYWFRVSSSRTRWLVILAVIIALSASYLTLGEKVTNYGQQATTLGRGEAGQKSAGTLTGRVPLWKYGFHYALDRPFGGYGFSTFINPQTKLKILRELGWAPNSMHSSYMDTLMGTGFIGLGLLLTIVFCSLGKAFRLADTIPDYEFVFTVLLWNVIISLSECGLLAGASVMYFIPIVFISRLAFLPAQEWQ
jgi:O-antigen ligase